MRIDRYDELAPGIAAPAAHPSEPSILDLFANPKQFFSRPFGVFTPPLFVIVAWCCGIDSVLGNIDYNAFRSELGAASTADAVGLWMGGSWAAYWGWGLLWGAVAAPFLWWFWGGWFHLRVRLSGAKDAPSQVSRWVFLYSRFVGAAPAIAVSLLYTLTYSDYNEAWTAEDWYSLLLVPFLGWSVFVGYAGVTTAFKVNRWKARVWFLILPALLYAAVFGGAIALELASMPSTLALEGHEVPAVDVATLRELGYLEPDEALIFFYSNGSASIIEDGNFFTDRRIVSYSLWNEQHYHASATYEEVEDVTVSYATDEWNLTWVTVWTHSGESIELIVSAEQGRDRQFVERLLEELDRHRTMAALRGAVT